MSDLFACRCDVSEIAQCVTWLDEAAALMGGSWKDDAPSNFVSRAIHELGGVEIHEDQWFGISTLSAPRIFVQCDRIEDGLALAVVEKHRQARHLAEQETGTE